MNDRYVIWSEEHGAWWAPSRQGYTRELSRAGRYSVIEATEIVTKANKFLHPSVQFAEIAIPDPVPPGGV